MTLSFDLSSSTSSLPLLPGLNGDAGAKPAGLVGPDGFTELLSNLASIRPSPKNTVGEEQTQGSERQFAHLPGGKVLPVDLEDLPLADSELVAEGELESAEQVSKTIVLPFAQPAETKLPISSVAKEANQQLQQSAKALPTVSKESLPKPGSASAPAASPVLPAVQPSTARAKPAAATANPVADKSVSSNSNGLHVRVSQASQPQAAQPQVAQPLVSQPQTSQSEAPQPQSSLQQSLSPDARKPITPEPLPVANKTGAEKPVAPASASARNIPVASKSVDTPSIEQQQRPAVQVRGTAVLSSTAAPGKQPVSPRVKTDGADLKAPDAGKAATEEPTPRVVPAKRASTIAETETGVPKFTARLDNPKQQVSAKTGTRPAADAPNDASIERQATPVPVRKVLSLSQPSTAANAVLSASNASGEINGQIGNTNAAAQPARTPDGVQRVLAPSVANTIADSEADISPRAANLAKPNVELPNIASEDANRIAKRSNLIEQAPKLSETKTTAAPSVDPKASENSISAEKAVPVTKAAVASDAPRATVQPLTSLPAFASPIDGNASAARPIGFTPSTIATDSFANVERVVEHLMAARQVDLSKPAAIAVAHREFGALTLTFDQSATGKVNVEIAAESNEAQRALAAAMANDRGAARQSDTPAPLSSTQTNLAQAASDRGASANQNGSGLGQGNSAEQRSQDSSQSSRRGNGQANNHQPQAQPPSDDALYA